LVHFVLIWYIFPVMGIMHKKIWQPWVFTQAGFDLTTHISAVKDEITLDLAARAGQ
jgi:hypothetical protein